MLPRSLTGVLCSGGFGPLSQRRASVETRVCCGPIVLGFPLKLAGLLFSFGQIISFILSLPYGSFSLLGIIMCMLSVIRFYNPLTQDPSS